MECEFNIPVNKEDLLDASSNDYHVKDLQEPSSLDDHLEESNIDFRNEGPSSILNHFDTYYSVLHHLSRLKSEIKAVAWTHILTNATSHFNSLPMILDPEGVDKQTRMLHLCTVKMEVYLMIQFMEEFENDAMKPETNVNVTKKGKSKKKNIGESWDWSCERTKGLSAINQLIQLDIHRLWDPPIVEDEFTNLVSGVCYKFLENQQIVRQKEDQDIIFQVLGLLIKKCNHQLGASLRIIQLVQLYEHLVSPLANALSIFVNEYGCKNIVGDILREIGRMDGNDLSRDTSGTRSFSLFIVELTHKIPSCVLPNIALLSSHLDGDSYPMRNGVLGVFAEIIMKILSCDNLEESLKKSRESLFDKLEDHIHDVHAFVRSKVIQLWIQICQEKAIPLSRQWRIVELVIGRLQDKSSQVRKYAVQFLKACLIGNPFAAKLPIEQLISSHEKEKEKLEQMCSDSCEGTPVETNKFSEEWLAIEDELKEAIVKHFDENAIDEDTEEIQLYEDDDNAIENVIRRIQNHLKEKQCKESLSLLQAAISMWKDSAEFQVSEDDRKIEIQWESEKDAHNIVENANADEDEHEKTINAEHTQKEDSYNVLLILLKKMFHASLNNDVESNMEIDLVEATQQAEKEKEKSDLEQNEIEKQKVLVVYLKDCVDFAQQMKKAIPLLCLMLRSKVNSDKLEAIEFFIAAHEFGVAQAEEGIRRMANLIWSRDPAVKKAVVEAFERLYIDVSVENIRNKANTIVKGLMSLINEADLAELTSLEHLICELMKMELIPQDVVQLLWQKFALKLPQTTYDEQRLSVIILSMMADAEKDIIKSNLSVLVDKGLVCRNNDLSLARDTCSAILKLTAKEKFASSSIEPFRLPQGHQLFVRLEEVLVSQFTEVPCDYWTPFCERAIKIIYNLSEFPDDTCGNILKKLLKFLMETHVTNSKKDKESHSGNAIDSQKDVLLQKETEDIVQIETHGSDFPKENEDIFPKANEDIIYFTPPELLSRILTLSGHIALMQLYHLDINIFEELKRRHRVKEEEEEKSGKCKKSGRKSGKDTGASAASTKQDGANDDDMGVGGAAAEDTEAEYIRKICEKDIVTGENLLAIFPSVAELICKNPKKFDNKNLQTAASLVLSKFMLVSSEFCDKHLQLLFTILEKSELPTIRSNTIIALGDLTFRFPNLIEPWTPRLYARLRDESVDVRKTTVTTLTFLILNDMVRVKGQISEMAICLEDKEEKIASAVRVLFTELARKGNALYNVTPDIISRLSDPDTGVEEKSFRTILRFLLTLIQKDKQAESLVEKLCHRFRATRTDRQWRDLAFCLSMLPYNEKGFKKLIENIACYQTKLSDEEVYNCFVAIITKSKKFAKPELKVLVDEFETTLQAYHTKTADDQAEFAKASKALSTAANNGNQRNADNGKKKPPRSTRKPKKAKPWEEDDSDSSFNAEKVQRSTRRSKKSKPSEKDDEDSDHSQKSEKNLRSTRKSKKSKAANEDDGDSECSNKTAKENRLPGKGKRRKTAKNHKAAVKLTQIFSSDDDDDAFQ